MQPEDIFGATGHRRDLVDIQIAGVAGKDRTLFDNGI